MVQLCSDEFNFIRRSITTSDLVRNLLVHCMDEVLRPVAAALVSFRSVIYNQRE